MTARGRSAVVALLALMTLAASACGASAPTAPSTPTLPSAPAPSTIPSPPVTTSAPSASPATSTRPGVSPDTGVVRDDSLLAILPAEVGGVPVTAEDASFESAAEDPAFAANVARAAFAIAVGPDDLATGVVAALEPGAFDDEFYRDWRDTYGEGACAQAGGVSGTAETVLGGRQVFITTCEGGIRVYNAWLEERGVLVSLFSIGEGRFGEQLMAGLRP